MQRLTWSSISSTITHLRPRLNPWLITQLTFCCSSLHQHGLYNQPLVTVSKDKYLYSDNGLCSFTRRKTDLVKDISQQRTVKDLVDLYTRQSHSPLLIFDAITKSTRKSAKQSIVLLQDLDVRDKYDNILKDVDSIGSSQTILGVLCSLAEITARQKAFLNRTGFDIYPEQWTGHVTDRVTETQETHHLTQSAKTMFLRYQSIIFKNGLDIIRNKELVKILWCFVETETGSKELYEVLNSKILEQEALEFTPEDIAHIVCCFAKIRSTVNIYNLITTMKNEISNRGLVGFRIQEIVNVLFSLATTGQGDSDFYNEFKKEILSRDVRRFNPTQLCQVLWSFVKVHEKYDLDLSDLINQFEDEILHRGIKRFDDRGVAVITWSFVKLEYFSKRLFTLIRNDSLKRNVRDYVAADISVILQSFAKVKHKIASHQIFKKIDKELVYCGFHGYSNRCLATTMWSFVETGNGTSALYAELKKEVLSRNIQDFTATEFSQTIWSFAKARQKVDTRDLFTQVNYDLSKLSLRQLALVGWSFAVARVLSLDFFTKLQREISTKDISKARNPVICQILYAFATAKDIVSIGSLSESIKETILANGAKSFGNRQLAVLVWSLGELNKVFKSSQVYEVLLQEVCNRPLKEYMPSDFCRILWSFAEVHHIVDTTLVFHSLAKELFRRGLWEFSIAEVTMATVALTKANKWDDNLLKLFQHEITCRRNSRHFESLHLCSLATSFASMNLLETNDLYCWLEDEVVDRNVSTLLPEELLEILGILVDRKATKILFFYLVKDQLMNSSLDNYDEEFLRKVCLLLHQVGVDTSDLQLKAADMLS